MTLKHPSEIATMAELRLQIDHLDAELIRLLALRQSHVDRAAELKPAEGIPARIDERIEAVISKVVASAEAHGFEPDTAAAMWRLMIEDMIAREERAMSKGTS